MLPSLILALFFTYVLALKLDFIIYYLHFGITLKSEPTLFMGTFFLKKIYNNCPLSFSLLITLWLPYPWILIIRYFVIKQQQQQQELLIIMINNRENVLRLKAFAKGITYKTWIKKVVLAQEKYYIAVPRKDTLVNNESLLTIRTPKCVRWLHKQTVSFSLDSACTLQPVGFQPPLPPMERKQEKPYFPTNLYCSFIGFLASSCANAEMHI